MTPFLDDGDPADWIDADDCDDSGRLRDFLPAALLAAVCIMGLTVASLVASPVKGQFLVIGPVLQGRGGVLDIVQRAEGGILGFGGLPNIAIAAADHPDFAQSLRDNGAWLVLPSPGPLGCFTAESPAS